MAKEDPDYIIWLAFLPCSVTDCQDRSGPPHHPRQNVGTGLRAHDHRAIPICPRHHEELHGMHGYFEDWHRQRVRDWLDDLAIALRNRYERIQNAQNQSDRFPR
jgi:hypothetical protein